MTAALTTDQFIARAKRIHGNKYDYSDSAYVNQRVRIPVRCPEHGVWLSSYDHINSKRPSGCPACAGRPVITTESFVRSAKIKYPGKFKYKKTEYVSAKKSAIVTCDEHGDVTINPYVFLADKTSYGCYECGVNARAEAQTWDKDRFVEKAQKVHDGSYEYSKVKYVNQNIKVVVTCKKHGDFKVTPASHLGGTDCRSCCKFGFNPSVFGTFYYARINRTDGKPLYMIGITNHSFEKRYSAECRSKMTLLYTKEYKLGRNALKRETALKQDFKALLFKGEMPINKGNTEVFTTDILGMDK